MARKKVKKEKTSERGKGDVKQSVKVSVRIGEAKPKRKRAYKRKPKRAVGEGGGDLARVGETRTLYGNLPPQTITIQQQPALPPQFQPAPQPPSITAGDVEKAKQNLLSDIQREISTQIVKAQGAEQRGELAKMGAFDPFNQKEYAKPEYDVNQRIQATAPSLTNIMKAEGPIISEPDEEDNLPFAGSLLIEYQGTKPKRQYRSKEEIQKEREMKQQKRLEKAQMRQQKEMELRQQKEMKLQQKTEQLKERAQMKSEDINVPVEQKPISKQQQLTQFFEPIKTIQPSITSGLEPPKPISYLNIGEEGEVGKEYLIKVKKPKKSKSKK